MKMNLIQECIDCLNAADVDREEDQKLISVCESYLLHSYDLYSDFCLNEGYEPVEVKDYMNQLLALNEGRFIRKMLGLAAAGAAAYGGAKVIRANQGYRAANGISSKPNATLGERIKSNGQSIAKMFKQSAGTGNSVDQKISNVYNNVVKGTKLTNGLFSTATEQNKKQWENGTITSTTDDSTGKKSVVYLKGDKDRINAKTGTQVVTQRVNKRGNIVGKKVKNLNPNTNVNNTVSNMQDGARQHNQQQQNQQKPQQQNPQQQNPQQQNPQQQKPQQQNPQQQNPQQQNPQQQKPQQQNPQQQKPQQQNNQQQTNESYSYIAENFKEPLTPSIRMPRKFI